MVRISRKEAIWKECGMRYRVSRIRLMHWRRILRNDKRSFAIYRGVSRLCSPILCTLTITFDIRDRADLTRRSFSRSHFDLNQSPYIGDSRRKFLRTLNEGQPLHVQLSLFTSYFLSLKSRFKASRIRNRIWRFEQRLKSPVKSVVSQL